MTRDDLNIEIGVKGFTNNRTPVGQRPTAPAPPTAACSCMTEDPGDGLGERVLIHTGGCPANNFPPAVEPARTERSRFVRSTPTPLDAWANSCYTLAGDAPLIDEWRADRDSVELMHELAHAGAVANGAGTWQPVLRRLGIRGESCTADTLRAGDIVIAVDAERGRCDLHAIVRPTEGTSGLAGFLTMTAQFVDSYASGPHNPVGPTVQVRPNEVHFNRTSWNGEGHCTMFRVVRNDLEGDAS